MAKAAVTDPVDFQIIIIGGTPAGRDPVVDGTVDGALGGPDTLIAIEFDLMPAVPTEQFSLNFERSESHLHLDFNLSAPPEPDILGQAAINQDWLVV